MERQLLIYRPSPERIAIWRSRAHDLAAKQAGFTYPAYAQLKIMTIVEELSAMIAVLAEAEDAEARAIRAIVTAHIHTAGFDAIDSARSGAIGEALIDFLRTHDLGFRIRRLRFMADRLTEIEDGDGGSDEAALQAARDAIYGSLALYLDLQMHDHYERPAAGAARAYAADIATAIAAIGATRNLDLLDVETDKVIARVLPLLSRGDRRAFLLAYLGFSFYDVATLSLMRVQGAQEFHAIQVDRISPDDCVSIRPGGAEATLKGIEFNRFGAFFSRAYRENDYLWGRLHGAERTVDIVLSTMMDSSGMSGTDVAAIKTALFRAIIDEERGRLTTIPDLIAAIDGEIAAKR